MLWTRVKVGTTEHRQADTMGRLYRVRVDATGKHNEVWAGTAGGSIDYGHIGKKAGAGMRCNLLLASPLTLACGKPRGKAEDGDYTTLRCCNGNSVSIAENLNYDHI